MPRTKPELQDRLLQVKQQAIIEVVNRLLATRGYDAMTVDAVAAEVGVSKASLYKLFPSKEALAGAAMVEVIGRAIDMAKTLAEQTGLNSLQRLKALTRWAILTKIEGAMPSLPAGNTSLSQALQSSERYMDGLLDLSMRLGTWVTDAQNEENLRRDFPADFILFNLYARACDPVIDVLHQSGEHTPEQIADMILTAHFEGLETKSPKAT